MDCVWCVLLVDYVRLRGHDGVGGSLRDCNTAVGAGPEDQWPLGLPPFLKPFSQAWGVGEGRAGLDGGFLGAQSKYRQAQSGLRRHHTVDPGEGKGTCPSSWYLCQPGHRML